MTEESFSARPINKEELSYLVNSGIYGHTRKETRLRIEKLKQAAGLETLYLAKENLTFLLCGFSCVDLVARQASLWLGESAETGSVSNASSDLLSKTMSFLLYEAFFQRRLHRISSIVNEKDPIVRKVFETSCWKQEGILADHFFENDHYCNGLVFAMLESDFHLHSTGLIPFLSGYLAVRATNRAIFSISILKEGENVPEYIEDRSGYRDRISANGKITRPGEIKRIYLSESAYPYLKEALEQMLEYVQGRRTRFDFSFEFSDATEFQKQVWEATIRIPFGQTRNYEEIAQQLRPNDKNSELRLLSRAVGTALGKNPILIAVPCHRIIGKDGKLKGFAAGLEVKDYLLSHEMLFLK